MRDVFELEPNTIIRATDSYIVSYPYLLSYFASKTSFGPEDVVRGAHMVYGWMPTILDLYPTPKKLDFLAAARLLNEARTGSLTNSELEQLACLVNNSLVGASKLIHFVAPNKYAIWDSKVYAFVFNERAYQNRVSKVAKYLKYQDTLKGLQEDPRFINFHQSMNVKIGYAVSPVRALELIMYLNAPKV